jgi:colicin import membrane protein
MSTVLPPESGVQPDPFRYGWRYVRRQQPDGTEDFDMVPLTLEDVLHPEEGDQILENSRHERHRRYFQDVFERRLLRQPTLLSLSDCRIDWDRPDLRPHGPDLIVLERDEPWAWRSWSTLHVQEERARPRLIIEVVSPNTRTNDVVDKVEHYHRAGVPLYVLVDEEQEEGPLRLVGYRHEPRGYAPLPLDEQGRLLIEPFGLYLVVVGERVAILDAATGDELGDYVAVSEALEAEVRARQAAEKAREEAEQARQAAEQRQRGEAEARQAAEQARQAAEQAREAAEGREQEAAEARKAAEQRQREEAEARQAAEQRGRDEAVARHQAETQAAQLAARLKQLEEELQRLRGS